MDHFMLPIDKQQQNMSRITRSFVSFTMLVLCFFLFLSLCFKMIHYMERMKFTINKNGEKMMMIKTDGKKNSKLQRLWNKIELSEIRMRCTDESKCRVMEQIQHTKKFKSLDLFAFLLLLLWSWFHFCYLSCCLSCVVLGCWFARKFSLLPAVHNVTYACIEETMTRQTHTHMRICAIQISQKTKKIL